LGFALLTIERPGNNQSSCLHPGAGKVAATRGRLVWPHVSAEAQPLRSSALGGLLADAARWLLRRGWAGRWHWSTNSPQHEPHRASRPIQPPSHRLYHALDTKGPGWCAAGPEEASSA